MKPIKKSIIFFTFITLLGWAAQAGASSQHIGGHDPQALQADPRRADGPIAPVLGGLGDHHHPVTTRSKEAQSFFDQGLRLTYGFNHQEALRSFKEAARLDPDCAMAYWGWALVLGPNLNLPMSEHVVSQAYEAIQLALGRKANATEHERAYIEALAKRYSADPGADRGKLDAAYSEAMREVHARYPDDLDAATFYAASLMNLSPWNYWTRDGQPRPHTLEILSTLESVMQRDAQHIGALHYYIHAVEAVDPDRGSLAADRLRGLTPGAGHLVHMPSHIYMQVGRYAESFALNAQAAKADENYLIQCRTQGIYPLGYYPHNLHFQAWAGLMLGKSAETVAVSRKVASKVPEDFSGNHWALYQTFASMPLFALVRFGQWEAVLTEPQPPHPWRYMTGMWHYARGLAYTHKDQLEMAAKERQALQHILENHRTKEEAVGFSAAPTLLSIAGELLDGEMAAKQKRFDNAISHLERAVRLEDSLMYNEPPDWYYPTRQTLGAILLEAGRPAEAEVVYWQDLKRYRNNGYSLYGLWQSLEAQGRKDEAAEIKKRFTAAWRDADITLASSRF